MISGRIYFFRGGPNLRLEWEHPPDNESNNVLLNLVLHTRFIGKLCFRMVEWTQRAINWPSSLRSKKLTRQLERKLNANNSHSNEMVD